MILKNKIQCTIQHRLQGTGIPCTRCVSHTGYLAYGNSKDEAREISRHKNNVRNPEERNVGTKVKSPKQDLTSAKDLTVELPEGREL